MRFLFSLTRLFLLPVLLLLSVVACVEQPVPSAQQTDEHTSLYNANDQIADVNALLGAASVQTLASEPEVSNPAHLRLAESYVGTTELTGNNDGPEIERFLASVKLAAGNPYCAAFVSYILEKTPGVIEPDVRSGLAYHFITDSSIPAKEVLRGSYQISPGDIFVWRKGNTIYGHTAFVDSLTGNNQYRTVEANTSSGVYGNQRDGDGVWLRLRSIQPGNYFRITHITSVTYA